LVTARTAAADTVIYSTVGTGFLTSAGWLTHGFDQAASEELQISVAMPFTIEGPGTSTIRTIEIGFSFDPTGEDFVEMDVLNDAGNGTPGEFVGGASFDLPFVSTPDRLLTVPAHIALTRGAYFLAIRTSGDIVGVWHRTTAPFFGGWESVNDGPWREQPTARQGAFRLSGDASVTPEPASLILLATGAAGLLGPRRRHNLIQAVSAAGRGR